MSRYLTRIPVALLALAAFAVAACGDDDDTAAGTESAPRTIEIDMLDIEFAPDSVEVADGETVKFVFHNEGAIAHDAFIGDEDAQSEHEEEMRSMDSGDVGDEMDDMGDEMEEHGLHAMLGDEPAITVPVGETGDITYTFHAGDDVVIGCHQQGHYEAGMKIAVSIA